MKMKKKQYAKNPKSTIHRIFILGTTLIFAAGLVGCSKLASLTTSPEQKQDIQNEAVQDSNSQDSPDTSEKPAADAEKSAKEENAKNPDASEKGSAAMEDGNLAALLGTSLKNVEQLLGKYDGNLDAAAKVGILTDYPGLTIEGWNDAGEIYSVTLLDAENPEWNIFDIRPGDSMDEAVSHITSLGAVKEPSGSMYDSYELYSVPYQEEKVHVELSDGDSGNQVDAIKVFFDANDMLGIDASDEPEIDGIEMFDAASNPHIAELQEKYPNALVSMDAVTKQIQYQEEWLEAEVYFVDDMANGMLTFAYTTDGKLYQMIDGEWKPEN